MLRFEARFGDGEGTEIGARLEEVRRLGKDCELSKS